MKKLSAKRKLKIFKENLIDNILEGNGIFEEQKIYYGELLGIMESLMKKNDELRKEWKGILISIIAKQ